MEEKTGDEVVKTGREATQFKSGDEWNGNKDGRPKGSISLISRIKREFRENPEKFDEFWNRYVDNPSNEKHVVEMIDGKPMQKTDITTDGDKIQPGVVILPAKEE